MFLCQVCCYLSITALDEATYIIETIGENLTASVGLVDEYQVRLWVEFLRQAADGIEKGLEDWKRGK